MEKALLIILIAEVVVVVLCLFLQSLYFKNLRHHHRENWEEVARRAPRKWRYFKGMPRTGTLVLGVVADRVYRSNETPGYFLAALLIITLNYLHVLLILGFIAVGVMTLL
ncbi:MAG: hypothetical protein AAF514_09310 [Verrucomicrobiota bacterium]